MTQIPIAITGVSGQMGRRLVAGVVERAEFRLVGGTLRPGHAGLGQDLGVLAGVGPLGVLATSDLAAAIKEARVLVDFTTPEALPGHLKEALAAGVALVIGTTGLGEASFALLSEAAQSVPVLWAPNMSLGVNLLYRLVAVAAAALGPDFDLEIFEAHHSRKKDAPSGTALKLAEVLAQARGWSAQEAVVAGREGLVGARPTEEIGVLALRGGDIVGEHTVFFCGQGERLELTHRAQSRDTFAAGALRAALWLVDKKPGLYSINHVLGLQ
ncbi:MAG: 4-hydroxy-tetrahydrodipicolinate reductase [Deltaproteobacteria bacterium]|jgi:4-hydroxy-tetrahydrodipicolinate reductase|nr:4-hydroxy-tetrahydrodipicolinate reductase [Deltaproteobacteria bacterium]